MAVSQGQVGAERQLRRERPFLPDLPELLNTGRPLAQNNRKPMSDRRAEFDPVHQIVGVVGAYVAPILFGQFARGPLAFLSPSRWGNENERALGVGQAERRGGALPT